MKPLKQRRGFFIGVYFDLLQKLNVKLLFFCCFNEFSGDSTKIFLG